MSKYAPDSPTLEDRPCDVCGRDPEDCICPECSACNSPGDPLCLVSGGPGCESLSDESKQALRAVARAALARLAVKEPTSGS